MFLSDILQVNLEVQWASEQAIMAVERAGGRITTGYFDLHSVIALRDPLKFFKTGSWTMTLWILPLPTEYYHRLPNSPGAPIPRRLAPPQDLMEYYSNPANRGYLADPKYEIGKFYILYYPHPQGSS